MPRGKRPFGSNNDRDRRPAARVDNKPRAKSRSPIRGRNTYKDNSNKGRNRPISPRGNRRRSPRKSPIRRSRERLRISPRRDMRRSPDMFIPNNDIQMDQYNFNMGGGIDLHGNGYQEFGTRFSPPDKLPNDPSDMYYPNERLSIREPQLDIATSWKDDDDVQIIEPPMMIYPPERSIQTDNIVVELQRDRSTRDVSIDIQTINPVSVIPEFDPERSNLTARQWVSLVQEVSESNNWTPDERKYHMCQKLAGAAKQWYLATNRVEDPWVVVKTQFLDAFPSDMDYHRLLQNMINRTKKHGESYATYLNQKNILLSKCGISGRKAISCIVGGITDGHVRNNAYKENFSDTDALYEYLRSIEKEKEEKKQTKVRNKVTKKESVERPPSIINYGNVSKETAFDKYYMDVSIRGNLLKGYIDFNCEYVTIREETARALNLSMTPINVTIAGFMGSSINAMGHSYVTLTVDRAIANVLAYVVPNFSQSIPVIVGQNFLKKPHVVVMQTEHSVRVYQRLDNGELNLDSGEATSSKFYY